MRNCQANQSHRQGVAMDLAAVAFPIRRDPTRPLPAEGRYD
jgi:hypothetical protein